MKDLRLTSPGLLLILAVVMAGGVFLLDFCYLHPLVISHRQAALKEQAVRIEEDARLALQVVQSSLDSSCQTWARIRQLPSDTDPQACQSLLAQIGQAGGGEIAWVCDAQGNITTLWAANSRQAQAWGERLPQTIRDLHRNGNTFKSGMLRMDKKLILFTQATVEQNHAGSAARTIGLAKRLNESDLANPSLTAGSPLFVPGNELPLTPDSTNTKAWQLAKDSNDLVVYWMVTDPAGNMLGYFQVQAPVTQAYRQSIAARRMVLVVLSLSIGLVLLIIMGMQVLVAGPVIRLLKRIQLIETGKSTADELTQDLHGEPLVLARRLESVFERLARQSKTDELTSIANRRHFEEVFQCFYHQARRYNRPLSLLVMDVDNFKTANDSGGHQYGDLVLQMVTKEIEACCRKADLPARWGGDEFAILMPETSACDALLVAQRICQAVKSGNMGGSEGKWITLSVGIADLNSGEIDSPDAMISLADRALYRAKETGRDNIVQAHDLNGLTWPGSSESGGRVETLRNKVAGLECEVRDFFMRTIEELVGLLRERDPHMADQATRVRYFANLLGEEMGLPQRVLERLGMAAMLHDIGMIAMPDSILLSTGPLNEQQLQVLHRHPLLSVRIMEGIKFLDQEIPPVRYHHERFDGKGYPEGLKGPEIPLTARVLAVADTLAAMTSPRCFRAAKTPAEALDEIRKSSGTQFDPVVVDALLAAATKKPQEFDLCEKFQSVPPPEELQIVRLTEK